MNEFNFTTIILKSTCFCPFFWKKLKTPKKNISKLTDLYLQSKSEKVNVIVQVEAWDSVEIIKRSNAQWPLQQSITGAVTMKCFAVLALALATASAVSIFLFFSKNDKIKKLFNIFCASWPWNPYLQLLEKNHIVTKSCITVQDGGKINDC